MKKEKPLGNPHIENWWFINFQCEITTEMKHTVGREPQIIDELDRHNLFNVHTTESSDGLDSNRSNSTTESIRVSVDVNDESRRRRRRRRRLTSTRDFCLSRR